MRWTGHGTSNYIRLPQQAWHYPAEQESAQRKTNTSKYKLKILSKLENLLAPRMDGG